MSSRTYPMKYNTNSSSSPTPSYGSLKDRLKLCFRCTDEDNDRSSALPKHEADFREMCRGMIGRRGRNRRGRCSVDFSYDPASYWLNFEDPVSGCYAGREEDVEVPLRGFLARLPATPERVSAPAEDWTKGNCGLVSGSRRELLACR